MSCELRLTIYRTSIKKLFQIHNSYYCKINVNQIQISYFSSEEDWEREFELEDWDKEIAVFGAFKILVD